MEALLEVILPVFLVIGAGYAVVWRGWFADEWVDGLMQFAQSYAIPLMLFRAISTLKLGQTVQIELLGSFYAGAVICFTLGILGARVLFKRPWEDAVAIGFCALFSNSLLLGVPITERAYGPDALSPNFAIIAFHAPFCYALGITVMEVVRNRGTTGFALVRRVLRAMFNNALIIGVLSGLAFNLSGFSLPMAVTDAMDLMVRAALPAALFGLGGVLYRYRPEGDMKTIAFVVVLSLGLHPLLTYGFGTALDLDTGALRSAVLTGAMAPGVNAYLFANMYGAARRVAASAVLIGTATTILSATLWLHILP
jgi:malonate transporter